VSSQQLQEIYQQDPSVNIEISHDKSNLFTTSEVILQQQQSQQQQSSNGYGLPA
jgi:hypothetical protein